MEKRSLHPSSSKQLRNDALNRGAAVMESKKWLPQFAIFMTILIIGTALLFPAASASAIMSIYNYDYLMQHSLSKTETHPLNNDYAVRAMECRDIELAEQTRDGSNIPESECSFDLSNRPCGAEGAYMVYLKVADNEEEEFAYDIRYDRDEWACECAGYDWSDEADFGQGECCGDDPGLYLNLWKVVVSLQETDIPIKISTPRNANINSSYKPQNEGDKVIDISKKFNVPNDQWVEYSFIIKDCYLIDTTIYAQIVDESTGSAILLDSTSSGFRPHYVFYRDSNEACNGFTSVRGKFLAEKGVDYRMVFYKGPTDTEKYTAGTSFGFTDMLFEVNYIDIVDSVMSQTNLYTAEVTEPGDIVINAQARMGGFINGQIGAVSVHTVPKSYITATHTHTNARTSGKDMDISVNIAINAPDADSEKDCGIVQSGQLCFDNPMHPSSTQDASGWGWLSALRNQGKIVDIDCLGMSAVSDGQNWVVCRDKRFDLPPESLPTIKCSEVDGYFVVDDRYCYKKESDDIQVEGSAGSVPTATEGSCTEFTVSSEPIVDCPISQCKILEGCHFGGQPHCTIAPDGTQCADSGNICAGGTCKDMTCAGQNGNTCASDDQCGLFNRGNWLSATDTDRCCDTICYNPSDYEIEDINI